MNVFFQYFGQRGQEGYRPIICRRLGGQNSFFSGGGVYGLPSTWLGQDPAERRYSISD